MNWEMAMSVGIAIGWLLGVVHGVYAARHHDIHK